MTETSLSPPLGTAFARLMLVAFTVVHIVLVFGPGPTEPAATVVALAAAVGAAAIVVLVPGRLLPGGWTIATVALTAASIALVVPWLPRHGWPGYASWPLGSGTFIAMGLTLRRRIGSAWISEGVMVALCLVWSMIGGDGPLAGVGLVDFQLGVLLIGTLFAIGLRRAERAHDDLLEVQRREALEQGFIETELRARREAAQRVLDEVQPTLERIAAGEVFDARERGRIAALEGRLRDEIALGPILSETLDQALAAARSRGVDVVVLTEETVNDLPTSVRLRASEWLATRLDRAAGSEFVGRVVARGRDLRVSATADERTEDRLLAQDDAEA
ncbi:MAG: hypothetical protein HIU86_11615 [Acidobacteria bacterium]|nr:hypothetical protein [Acidobacteriota bacterium]